MNIYDNNLLDSSHLFPNKLSCLGDFLVKFSEKVSYPVSIRSFKQGDTTKDMKIIMHNTAVSELRGFKEGSMVGMTLYEVLESLQIEQNLIDRELQQAEANEQEAIENNSHSSCTQTTLDAQGFIRIFHRTVTPLSGLRGKTIAIAIISQEITRYADLLDLLQTYKNYHENKSKSVDQFSKYFNLHKYLDIPLCYEELRTLLGMVLDTRHKQVAKLLNISPSTVNSYLNTVKDKLKPNIDLYTLLCSLRSQHQLSCHF